MHSSCCLSSLLCCFSVRDLINFTRSFTGKLLTLLNGHWGLSLLIGQPKANPYNKIFLSIILPKYITRHYNFNGEKSEKVTPFKIIYLKFV